MKKAVAFLLVLFIFVAPVTTFVKADVVIGDNDETIMNENATILGRKLAMLESMSDLSLSGVTEYTISNTDDVDSYLDSLWSEINAAIEYLDSGEWVGDIPNNIASKYYTNLVKYRDVVNNRGEFLGFDLQNPATSLLKTYFANDTYGKKYTSTGLYQTLDMVRSLNGLNRGETINPDENYASYLRNINSKYTSNNTYYNFFWKDINITNINSSWNIPSWYGDDYSYVYSEVGVNYYRRNFMNIGNDTSFICRCDPITINIRSLANGQYTYTVSPTVNIIGYQSGTPIRLFSLVTSNPVNIANINTWYNGSGIYQSCLTHTSDLQGCLATIQNYFRNVNIYVDDVAWSLVFTSNNPTIDIDGFLKIFGNDNPQQYELQPNTQIDYDQLYQVIYNAIRDNLPISQGDINYYDSHDTIYSPTIINNYGEEEGDESHLIDTILDYAVIPKFDTAIAQPMRQALTNGVVIMNNSITNVIPNEILLILGACFFLLLFAVVINRMIK